MVAVVNGSGLGLFTSRGSSGAAGLGQSRDQVFVNSTTGNLVIQGADEFLTATGADLAVTRTYNSLGITDGDNNDGWRIGVLRSLAINAGVNIVKTFGDGARVTYNWNGTEYVSTEGDGAHDKITASGSNWVWTDGSSRDTETYDSTGKLLNSKDGSGNTVTYTYGSGVTANVIVQISVVSPSVGNGGDASTTVINLSYLTGTLDLGSIATVRNGVPETLTYYTYDGQHRLSTVTVDLSPANNSTSDNDTLVTTYTYQGTTNLVASITQKKGGSANVTASMSFTYQLIDNDYRLKTYTDGESHTTTLTYTTPVTTSGSNTTANANSGVLSTTETQNVTNTYNLNTSAVSTTDTTTNTYNVNSAALTTNATQTNAYNRNDAVLSTTNTTTNTYNLNSAALTTPAGAGAWGTTPATIDVAGGLLGGGVGTPKLAFDANGNGFAIWAHFYNSSPASIAVSRYTRSNNTWGPISLLQSGNNYDQLIGGIPGIALAVDSATGNAVAAWQDVMPNGTPINRASYFNSSTGTWSTPVSMGGGYGAPQVSISGSNAAIAYADTSLSLVVSRWNGASWLAGQTVATTLGDYALAIDNQANVNVIFTQSGVNRVRYTASTNTWSSAAGFGSATSSNLRVQIDSSGNGFAVWSTANDVMMSRYTRSNNTWTAATAIDSKTQPIDAVDLAVDSVGNAVVGWVQSDGTAVSAFAKRYVNSTSTWSSITALESSTQAVISGPGAITVSMAGGKAAASWMQTAGSIIDIVAATFDGTNWSAASTVESFVDTQLGPVVSVDPLGNATAMWISGDSLSLYANRFAASGGGAPYYTVPSGATWQSVANALYGINSAAAGTALQTAMGNPALTTGAQLTGWPATLSVTTTVTVAAYYNVPAGATWQSIANAVYGINSAAAGTALQTAMGNPTLSTGLHLTGFPATLSVTTTLAAHYLVPASATWQSIANALYGVNSAAAGTALQTALGNPSIATGQRLYNIPATLAVTTTTTVAAYYLVPSGATWQSIANAVYGVNSAAAGTALQTAMGNPALSTGLHLTGLPATLSVTTTLAPHYLVPSGATWQSIANALFGINSAAAGTALQTALGNPSIATGQRLFNIPATLTVTTTVTVPAYYTIPSSPTWQAITNTLYGVNSAAAGSALQTALGNPTLTPGNRLTNLPPTLSVTTSQNVTVPAYYVVPAGATWTSITQAVYNTSHPNAVAALQTATGNPALTTNLHLTVPLTLTYAVSAGSTLYRNTDVVDAMGFTYSYQTDTLGRLTNMFTPTVGGVRIETRYGYDAEGNISSITQDPAGLNRVTTMFYSNGNLTLTRDNAGNTVARTYSTTNQVLTETTYLVPDPDAANTGASPGTPLVSHFVYDSADRLRFVVTPEGRVTEYRYQLVTGMRQSMHVYTSAVYTGSTWTESGLASFVTTNQGQTERTNYLYDFRGNLSEIRRFVTVDSAGVGTGTPSTTLFTYDQRGLLKNTTEARGAATTGDLTDYVTSYLYDGLGRQTQRVEWINGSVSRTTNTVWKDATRQFDVTLTQTGGASLVTTTTYDRAGAVTSVANAGSVSGTLGTTSYLYDVDYRVHVTTDANLNRVYCLYDSLARKTGEVDANGRLTQFVYNSLGQLTKTIRYSSFLSTATMNDLSVNYAWADADALALTLATVPGRDATKDQITRSTYDAAGRVEYTVDPNGGVTRFFYDGASRVTGTLRYAATIGAGAAPSSVGTDPINDRRTRNFYDNDGKLLAALDAMGFVVEYEYDKAGHLVHQIAYANPTSASNPYTDALNLVRPATDTESSVDYETDGHTYFYYDGQGRQIATLDAEGYLTELTLDLAGNATLSTRYQNRAAYSSLLATVRAAATGANLSTGSSYDGVGRSTSSTNAEGTPTNITYNALDEITSTTTGDRTQQTRYDELGRVTQELGGEGSAQTPMSETIWTQWGVTHTLDAAGRRIRSVDQYGNRTLYYYDIDNRLRFTVKDLGTGQGEVTETVYDSLGQITDTVAYTTRIAMTGINGGALDSTLQNAVNAVANVAIDSRTKFTYKPAGQVATQASAEGALTTNVFNGFGELDTATIKINATQNRVTQYKYDKRGLLTKVIGDESGINQTTTYGYDAFGRRTSTKDQYNNTSRYEYDRIGRTIATYSPINAKHVTNYDAFARVTSTVDAFNNTTTYTYNVAAKSMTVTTPESVSVTSVHNMFGQTLTVTDGVGNVTNYQYNKDGNLTQISDNLGTIETRTYDRAGRVETSRNGVNVVTRFTYDAVSRTFTRTQDYGGLGLVTIFTYDGQGRVTRVTEPGNRVTDTSYYTDGRVKMISVDPNGANLRTLFEYDAAGDTVKVTEHYLSSKPEVTQYKYDNLNRRIEEIRDPGGLDIHTLYKYDRNGNLSRRIEGSQLPPNEQRSTWYVYDANGRLADTIALIDSVNSLGVVTENTYDAENHVVAVKRYATAVSTSGFGDVVASVSPTANPGLDRLERTAYDKDGRAAFTINALGEVTQRKFDANGNVIRTRQYEIPIGTSSVLTAAQVLDALWNAGNNIYDSFTDNDRQSWTAYDIRGRATFLIDVTGGVIRKTYDLANEVIETEEFAQRYAGTAKDFASLTVWAGTTVAGQAYTVDNDPNNRTTKFWYDGVGRQRYRLDALGYLTETSFNDASRITVERAYVNGPFTLSTSTATTSIAGLVTINSEDRVTTTELDQAGRKFKVTDAYGYFEQYTYDDAGNTASFRNKAGAVWDYVYDVLGRLTDEYSPSAAYYDVTDNGATLSPGAVINARIRTHLDYTVFDNVWKRTEAFGTNKARTTEYRYDLLGRQVRTYFPAVGYYDASADSAYRVGSSVVRTDTAPQSLYTEVTYNTLGDAVVNRDVAGNYSYRVYDQLGRIRHEVDAEAYITTHQYDRFGNEWMLVRRILPYVGTLNGTALTADDILNQTTTSDDRVITKAYDKLNRLVGEYLPAAYWYSLDAPASSFSTYGPATQYSYNVFGEKSQKSVLVTVDASGNGTWANTNYFQDKLGRTIAEVDPKNYLTATEYDAVGNMKRRVEYAAALSAPGNYASPTPTNPLNASGSAIGYDRDTSYGYDRLNRLTTETNSNTEYSTISGSTPPYTTTRTRKDVVTTYGYDVVGNRISVMSDNGATVYSYYDALGRVRAVADASRNAGDGSTMTPIMEFRRDARGDVVQQIRYATTGTSISSTNYSVAASGSDQVTTSLLDAAGRVLRMEDPTGADRFTSYTARGDIAKEWQLVAIGADAAINDAVVTIHQYDRLGREVAILQPQTLNAGGSDTTPNVIAKTVMKYNAFGEMEQRGTFEASGTPTMQEFFTYDHAGRLWRTNSGDGVAKVYLYDLAGRQTAEFRARYANLGSSNYTTGEEAWNVAAVNGAIRVNRRFDLAGRLIEERMPTYNTTDLAEALDLTLSIGSMNKSNDATAGYRVTTNTGNSQIATRMEWAPTVTGAEGGYRRDKTRNSAYSYVTSRYIYWADPPNIVGEVSQIFEYRVAGSGSGWTAVTVDQIFGSDNKRYLGVAASTFGSGSYEIRLKYLRAGDTAPFAIRTGTITNPPSTSSVVTDTTASNTGAQASVSPVSTQMNDRWGNVIAVTNALNETTNYRYDQRGQLLEKMLPSVSIVSVNGTTGVVTTSTGRPKTENHYDAMGRLVATKDPNGVVNVIIVNEASAAIGERHADGGNVSYVYDAFGNRIGMTDELLFKTRYSYDKHDLQTNVEQEAVVGAIAANDTANIVVRSFGYDELGRRVTDTDGLNHAAKTWYDLRGNVKKRATAQNFTTKLVSDLYGNTILETNAYDEWKDWTYDYFGRLLNHRELGTTVINGYNPNAPVYTLSYEPGFQHVLTYDQAGLLTSMTSTAGQNNSYTYDAAGHLTRISETGTATGASGLVSTMRQTDIIYDALGRHTRERTVVDGLAHQSVTVTYDAAGRLSGTWDLNAGLAYSYDAAGNRTRMTGVSTSQQNSYTEYIPVDPRATPIRFYQTNYSSLGWYASLTSRDTATTDFWYQYDVMGRLTISRGANLSGTVTGGTAAAGQDSIVFTYDVAGNRKTQKAYGTKINQSGSNYTGTQDFSVETYQYDGARRLKYIYKDNVVTPTADYTYDAASRQTVAKNRVIEGSGLTTHTQTTVFDNDNRLVSQTTTKTTTAAPFPEKTEAIVNYGNGTSTRSVSFTQSGSVYVNPVWVWTQGFDATGNLRGYSVRNYDPSTGLSGTFLYELTYSTEYRPGENYMERSTYVYKSSGSGTVNPNTTRKTYNLAGDLVSATDDLVPSRNRYFANSANGTVLTSVQGGALTQAQITTAFTDALNAAGYNNSISWQRYFFANGNSLGSLGVLNYSGEKQILKLNVDDGSINTGETQAPAQVVSLQNETLRDVAKRIWGDSNLWYILAQENGYTDPAAVLATGTVLRVPNQVVSVANNSDVYQPFDMSAAIGSTQPFAHYRPKEIKPPCGGLGAVIVIVIAMILTALFDRSGSSFRAAMAYIGVNGTAASVAAAVAASVIAQGIGIAIGAQEKFDWKQVAMAAVSAGIAKGIGDPGGKLATALKVPKAIAPYFAAAVNGAVANALTQSASIAMGMQDSFSWRDVAVSGVASAAAFQVGKWSASSGETAQKLASGFAGSVVRGVLGGRVDVASMVADAFGNALGDSIVNALNGADAAKSSASLLADSDDGGDDADEGEDDLHSMDENAARIAAGDSGIIPIDEAPAGSGNAPVRTAANDGDEIVRTLDKPRDAKPNDGSSDAADQPESKWALAGSSELGNKVFTKPGPKGGKFELLTDGTHPYYDQKQHLASWGPLRPYQDENGLMAWGYQDASGETQYIRMDDPSSHTGLQGAVGAVMLPIGRTAQTYRYALAGASAWSQKTPQGRLAAMIGLAAGSSLYLYSIGQKRYDTPASPFMQGDDVLPPVLVNPNNGPAMPWTEVYPAQPPDWLSNPVPYPAFDQSPDDFLTTYPIAPQLNPVYSTPIDEGSYIDPVMLSTKFPQGVNSVGELTLLPLEQQITLDPELQQAIWDYNMGPAPGQIRHHLIVRQALTELPELMRKAAEGGFNIHGTNNGEVLDPTDHVGGHPLYNADVINELRKIPLDLPNVEIATRIQTLSDTIRLAIRNGWVPRE